MQRVVFAFGLGLMMAGTSLAYATDGQVVDRADLLAGPAENFPNVRPLPEGAQVEVHGCLQNMRWCDVTWRGKRGWVDSMKIAYAGERMQVPTVAFDCAKYWDTHYKAQFFYTDKDKWLATDQRARTIDISSAN
jgi:uncharacterized protein YraI